MENRNQIANNNSVGITPGDLRIVPSILPVRISIINLISLVVVVVIGLIIIA